MTFLITYEIHNRSTGEYRFIDGETEQYDLQQAMDLADREMPEGWVFCGVYRRGYRHPQEILSRIERLEKAFKALHPIIGRLDSAARGRPRSL